jgi:hypothetical protein
VSSSFHIGDNINQSGGINIAKSQVSGTDEPATFQRPARSPLVFVNYRATDDKAASYIDTELTRLLGPGTVFRDGRMPAGTEFPAELLERSRTCPVMIAVIGERWDDTYGRRLLDDPRDWVRREIATALRHGVYLAPVLVGARARPAAADLPPDIRRLAYLQARHLRSGYDQADVRRLVTELVRDLPMLATIAGLPPFAR